MKRKIGTTSITNPMVSELDAQKKTKIVDNSGDFNFDECLKNIVNGSYAPPKCDHTWNYNDGVKTCVDCNESTICHHESYTFDLGHRTCADCGMVSFAMSLERDAPSKMVYARSIKHGHRQFPVIDVGMNPNDKVKWETKIRCFKVSVELLVDGTFEPLVDEVLSGIREYSFHYDELVQDNGKQIIFKNLKINATSKQTKTTKNGTQVKNNYYILQWSFYAMKNNEEDTPYLLATVRSQPIIVFSHSKQIDEFNKQNNCLANVDKMFPCVLDSHSTDPVECSIFGNDLFEGTRLKIAGVELPLIRYKKFDNCASFIVSKELYTKVGNLFRNQMRMELPIYISNNSKEWVKTHTTVTFVNEKMLAQQLMTNVGEDLFDFEWNIQ
jgi:hypothetical protein